MIVKYSTHALILGKLDSMGIFHKKELFIIMKWRPSVESTEIHDLYQKKCLEFCFGVTIIIVQTVLIIMQHQ